MMVEELPQEREIAHLVQAIEKLKEHGKGDERFSEDISSLESKLVKLREELAASLTPWQRVVLARHPKRPRSLDYIKNITEEFIPLHGDRCFGDDHAIVAGFAKIGPMRCMVVAQEKGHDTESRLFHNFGMARPEGYRKAMRIFRLAEKFHLPVVVLIDTPGAYAALDAEERGIATTIAESLALLSGLETLVLAVVIGEGCSGGAIAIALADSIAMLQNSYYTVVAPESCATILWKKADKKSDAADVLKLTAEDLLSHELIDAIIEEPEGGAHLNPTGAYQGVKNFLLSRWQELSTIPIDLLVKRRYVKFRQIGVFEEYAPADGEEELRRDSSRNPR